MPININGSYGISLNNGVVLGSNQSNVLQIKRVSAGPTRQTIASLTPVLLTGLQITITPISALSTMIITANIAKSDGFVISFGIFKNGVATVSTTGQTNTNEPNMQVTNYTKDNNNYFAQSVAMHYEPSVDTAARTYGVYGTSGWAGVVYTFYVNDRVTSDMACFSTLDVMEVLI